MVSPSENAIPVSSTGPLEVMGQELLREPTTYGYDWYRICRVHKWSSRESVRPEDTERCPFCSVSLGARHGALRYTSLITRLWAGL